MNIRVFGNNGSINWSHLDPEKITYANIKGEKKIIERRSKLYVASKKIFNRFKAGHIEGFLEAYANFYNEVFNEYNYFIKNKKHSKGFFYSFNNFGYISSNICA